MTPEQRNDGAAILGFVLVMCMALTTRYGNLWRCSWCGARVKVVA